jgi:hypothetical protein
VIPKNTILRLLAEGIKSGTIKAAEVQALLPKPTTTGRRKVPKPIRDRATALSTEMGILDDGLRFSAMKGDIKYSLYLFNTTTNAVAGKRLSEPFADLGDMKRAADVVLHRYLETLT